MATIQPSVVVTGRPVLGTTASKQDTVEQCIAAALDIVAEATRLDWTEAGWRLITAVQAAVDNRSSTPPLVSV